MLVQTYFCGWGASRWPQFLEVPSNLLPRPNLTRAPRRIHHGVRTRLQLVKEPARLAVKYTICPFRNNRVPATWRSKGKGQESPGAARFLRATGVVRP